MHKILKSKKGISPILATLLLVVIAVAAIVVTYAWVITFTSTQTGIANEWIEFTNVRLYDGNKVDITLMVPAGKSNAKVMEMYIGPGSYGNASKQTSTSPSLPQAINAGQSLTITVTYTYATGTRYYMKAVTETARVYMFDQAAS